MQTSATLGRGIGWGLAVALPLLFLALFFGWPVGAMLWRGVGDGLTAVTDALASVRTWKLIAQTLGMACAATTLSIVVGVPAAFVLYKLRFPGQQALRSLVIIPFVLPTVAVGVAFRSLLAPTGPLGFLDLDQSVLAVILAMVFFNMGLVARTVGQMWAVLGDTDEVARTLGASPAQAFRLVTLPQLTPAIAAAGGLVFMFCSTSFGIVQTLGRPGWGTLESEIYLQTVTYLNLNAAAVLSVLQILIVVAAILVSNWLTRRSESALDLEADNTRPLRKRDAGLLVFVVFTVVVLIVAPIASLLLSSLRKDGVWTLHYYRSLAESGAGYSGGATVLEALEHSVKIAFDASLIALFIGVPLAFVLSRKIPPSGSPALRRWQKVLDGIVLLPLGISAVTVGFGFLITWGALPNLASGAIVPFAQAIVALPLVIRSLVPILRSISAGLREAAATLGASPWRVLIAVDLQFLLRAVGVAYGFAFAISLGEFGATSFLASPNYQTLPVLIAKLLGRPGADNYGMALAGTVLLIAVTAFVMALAEAFRPGALTRLRRVFRSLAPQKKGGS